ncbi:hypothetical protein C8Q80DRAFT_1267566 [Daedaleopsis nitida]|nr:hypothetical protein C8Q80DRAFT_1267566 [Daedaleopsis nitida]
MIPLDDLHSLTVVVDDVHVHYNVSYDALQPVKPNAALNDFLGQAGQKAWNNTLTIITTSSVSFWYNFTGFDRVAVYGSIYGWFDVPGTPTPWANYSIDGQYTAGQVTGSPRVITDYPLFVSERLSTNTVHYLNVEISASPDAPFVLDYVMGYQQPTPTPIAAFSEEGVSKLPVKAIVGGAVGGFVLMAIIMGAAGYCLWRRRKRKTIWTEKLEEPFSPHRPTLRDHPFSSGTETPVGSLSGPAGQSFDSSRSRSISFAPDTMGVPATYGRRQLGSLSSTHTRSSSQLPLLTPIASPPIMSPDSYDRQSLFSYNPYEPLVNPYDLLSQSSGALTSADIYASTASRSTNMTPVASAIAGSSEAEAGSTADIIELGPNGYPLEKKSRNAGSSKEQMYVVNADAAGPSPSSTPGHSAMPPVDSPPAYGT